MKKQLKKNPKNNIVTKDDIQELKNDLKDLEIHLTQTNLDIKQQIRSTEHYLEYRTNTSEKKLDNFVHEFNKLKDWMYDKLDWLVKAYTKYDQEYTVLSDKYIRTGDELKNHETRIVALEKKTVYKTS